MFFVYDEDQPFLVKPQFFTIDVKLSIQSDFLYTDGMNLWQAWEDYCEYWRSSAPAFLQKGFYFTDTSGSYHWFFLQDKITSEAVEGMALALGCACIVLFIATGNVVVALAAILCICFIVSSVVAFMFLVGWKLGVLEALVLVMVIGLSVDYVVHMADSYLEAPFHSRLDRTQFMLRKMGLAVINGATTTIGAAIFMCATYITFFQKFGIVVLVTVFQSLLTSMFFFSALMATMGPEGTFGSISYASLRSGGCFRRTRADDSEAKAAVDHHVEEAATEGSAPVLLGGVPSTTPMDFDPALKSVEPAEYQDI